MKDDRLVIEVPLELLKFATENYAALEDQDDDGNVVSTVVTDLPAFAGAVVEALRNEDEDGTTLVHEALDAALLAAIENGAEGVDLPDEIIRKRKREGKKSDG